MSKPGCPCKNAKEISPSCTYCPKGKTPQFDPENAYDTADYAQPKEHYNPYQGGYNDFDKNKKEPGRYDDDDGSKFKLNESSWMLLKAVLVFTFGCFLTMQMGGVATELG